MGLDMYMKKVNKLTGDTVDEECAYWRKANQIRAWIVEHTDYPSNGNCTDYRLTQSELKSLVADCKRVLLDHSLASKLLPTSAGFFFGDTEYNERYFDNLESTVQQVGDIIKTTDFDMYDIYYTEWW